MGNHPLATAIRDMGEVFLCELIDDAPRDTDLRDFASAANRAQPHQIATSLIEASCQLVASRISSKINLCVFPSVLKNQPIWMTV